jgi:hypothetical protein
VETRLEADPGVEIATGTSRIPDKKSWNASDLLRRSAGPVRGPLWPLIMKTILAIILIIAGVGVFFQGLNRRETVAGQLDAAGSSIANEVDGGARQPRHVVMMVVGGALVLVGIGVATRRTPVIR